MKELYISVDVETSGPIPGEFSLLTIGACAVDDTSLSFQSALRPLNKNADPEALKVTGLSLEELDRTGKEPKEAMADFSGWLERVSGSSARPVFVGLNAPFDWSFINYYFHRYLGKNPFGFSALDIKALYMGATGCTWSQTTSTQMAKRLRPERTPTHDALDDALYQAELFRRIREGKPVQRGQ